MLPCNKKIDFVIWVRDGSLRRYINWALRHLKKFEKLGYSARSARSLVFLPEVPQSQRFVLLPLLGSICGLMVAEQRGVMLVREVWDVAVETSNVRRRILRIYPDANSNRRSMSLDLFFAM